MINKDIPNTFPKKILSYQSMQPILFTNKKWIMNSDMYPNKVVYAAAIYPYGGINIKFRIILIIAAIIVPIAMFFCFLW